MAASLTTSSKLKGGLFPPLTRPQSAAAVVLVVEDHEDTRFLLKILLEARGLTVIEAVDGEQALEVAERERPDLILLDGSLPRLDGYSVTRRLRESAALGKLPIVFLSGHIGPNYQAIAFSAGCDDYLIKPLDINHLDRVLAKHLSHSKFLKPREAAQFFL